MSRKTKTPNNEDNDNSRRGVIKTLGLGLSLATLPAFISAESVNISTEALDPGESIIPLEERDLIEMHKFIEDCITANKDSNPQEAVKEVLARAVSNPSEMLKAIGPPTEAGLKVFLRSKDITIFAASWTPQMNLMPHNHLMWANIGIYTGREDNILWKRTENGLEASKAKCLFEGDVAMLNANAIHSVTNPLKRFTGGLHIYGGDFFATERSQWDPETLIEEPSNGDVIKNIFKEANEQLLKMKKD
ncbi:hypothetical protein [Aestuariibaculum suncheonense]|uniref:Uncharacterized protein n=1 Tax=Aestuariibaculum suncheonense TaxID=1028745 RepID=A0A8J6Q6Z7_9FLAO|nr:hypothetical protein [Aestuariibaculum suncheonense]MBD0835151.1 hypothetical protein [Aestuariibaculum suncheonense]